MAAEHRIKMENSGVRLPADMPWFEQQIKQIRHRAWLLRQCLRKGKRPPVLYVWPEFPSKRAALYKMARCLGWELTNVPRGAALGGIRFEDTTEQIPQNSTWPANMQSSRVWNDQCSDIRKTTLERAHVKAFGYGMAVNPITHDGLMVVKSDENAKHDGQLVQGPLDSENVCSDVVYQLNINNRDDSGRYYDYRIVWIGGQIPLIYQKFKVPDARFTNATVDAKILPDVSQVLSNSELEAIRHLTSIMCVDYAELDALRDRQSGRLFVVDVNPTPWGPPAGLNRASAEEAIHRMAQCLKDQLLPSSK